MAKIGKDMERAVELLNGGNVVAIPTETVYGLAGNALDSDAIKKIYAIKNRPANNPLIVHIANIDCLTDYAEDIPSIALDLAQRFWPGPLTLLLNKTEHVIDAVTAGLPKVAIRVPAHPLTLELLNMLSFPLAAPSANPYGYISPTEVMHVDSQLGDKIDYILDGGPCSRGLESTIVGFEGNTPIIYRKGVITAEDIKKVTGGGDVSVFHNHSSNPITSGMSLSHYSPRTPVYLTRSIDRLDLTSFSERLCLLTFKENNLVAASNRLVVLSPGGNMEEAAKNLYEALHRLDTMQLDLIIAELAPDEGVGAAINDRLTRAARGTIPS